MAALPNIVFVVGAGASYEFGLPLGSQLASKIRERLFSELSTIPEVERPIIHSAMFSNNGLHGYWSVAARELAAGLVASRSIDRLLDSRDGNPLVTPLGKYSIARLIAEHESATWLNRSIDGHWQDTHIALANANQTWIANLFSLLQEGKRPSDAAEIFHNIGFVTFNYDRLIERYLLLAFQHVLSLPEEVALKHVEAIPVKHVYGSLGSITSVKGDAIPFGPDLELAAQTVSSFRTFTEGVEDGTLGDVREMIAHAQLIVFLGFAFDPMNVDALFGKPLADLQRCIATTVGLSGREIALACGKMGRVNQPFEMLGISCAELIKSENFRNAFYVD